MTSETRDQLGHWASPKAAREFTELDRALRQDAVTALCEQGWSAAPDETDVETAFGTTHVSHYQGSGRPIVLLHGAGTTSLMWFPLLNGLVGHSVYAIDVVGEPGLSTQRRPIRDRADLTDWLGDVLDRLGVERPCLVGASYGGWIALTYTARTPHRVGALILVEPVFARPRPWFWVHGLAVALALVTPRPLAHRALRRLHMNTDLLEDKRVRRHAVLGLTRYRRGLPRDIGVTDEDLAAIDAPTLLLLGKNSELHSSKAVQARVNSAAPQIDTQLVPDAGHGLPVHKPEEVATRLESFLATNVPS